MSGVNNWFGIDFGTTNSSTVGILQTSGGSELIRYGDEYGGPFPSLVAVDKKTGEVFCGRNAWEKRKELSGVCEVISSIKSYLGTAKTWLVAGEHWSAEMIAARIFKSLKAQVMQKHGFVMDEAVISIPVGFSAEKRSSLRHAARMAGIKVKSFINESTAAFFRNYEDVRHFTKAAVFDWGGGTLDVSVIENSGGKLSELSVGGIQLGGDDIDLKLAQWVHARLVRDKGIRKTFEEMPPRFQDMMIARSERAKKELGETDSTVITLNNYGDFGIVRVPIDIDVFKLLIEPEISRAISCLEDAVRDANLSMEEIECIIMVGGSSNLGPLVERIENRWKGPEIIYPEDSVWNVAEGAALLSKKPGNLRLNQDIGLILSDESYFPIKAKDDPIPGAFTDMSFGIVEDSLDARFVFTDNTIDPETNARNILGYKLVPTYGFFKEQIRFNASIDEDLIFRAEIRSTNRPEQFTRTWQYPGLKFYYELPDRMG